MTFMSKRLFLRWIAAVFLVLTGSGASGQIVNRLKVDDGVFQRYAYCRMQQFNEANLGFADTLYRVGVAKENFRYKCLGLTLEFPIRFAQGDYGRMDAAVAEIKGMLQDRKDKNIRAFYYPVLHEYCQFLIHIGRASDAMLEARGMERIASEEKSPLGRMYAHRVVGLIQSYRTNSYLAIENFTKAAEYCKEARAEQELPSLLILIAQEYIKMGDFEKSERFCAEAETYAEYFPSLKVRILMTRALQYNAQKDWDSFWNTYETLVSDPLYKVQADSDSRFEIDVEYLKSKGLFEDALAKADSLGTARQRHDKKHGIFAAKGEFQPAYGELGSLMTEKDSIYIKVQNEDMAILDAEMNNAQLREDAQRLKSQNQTTVLLGFLAMFAIAFFSILFSQWQLRQNLDEMRRKNGEALAARRAFQKAMDSKESENDYKIKILQNRTTNVLTDYEDFLNS